MGDDRNTELAETLAEFGRRVGQAVTDAVDSVRPAFGALTEVAGRPEVRALMDRAERAMQRRVCLCWCQRAHPADRDVCEALDAVISGQHGSGLLGDAAVVPLCAPCAAARAARDFAG